RLDKGMSAEEIQKDLEISEGTYQKKLRKFEIETEQLKANKNSDNITKEDILSRLEKGMGSLEICKDLHISHSTFLSKCAEFEIKTKTMTSKELLASIAKGMLEEAIERLKSRKLVCEEFGITTKQYNWLCTRHEIKTEAALAKERAASITKEQLIDLLIVQKKRRAVAAKELGVTVSTIDNKIIKFKIPIKSDIETKQEIIDNITREQLEEVENSNLGLKEKAAKLQIGTTTYTTLLYKKGLKEFTPEELALKSKIEILLGENDSVKDVAKELNMSYSNLHLWIDRFSISTKVRDTRSHNRSIDKEKFAQMVQLGFSKSEIKEEFQISEDYYYKLIYKLDLATIATRQIENIDNISKDEFLDLINKNCSRSEICLKLNISKNGYRRLLRKFKITTSQMAINEHAGSISKEELSSLIAQGYKKTTICDILDISDGTYTKLVKIHKIPNYKIQEREHISQITKEKLESLLTLMSPNAASQELRISSSSVYRLMLKFKIHPSQQNLPPSQQQLPQSENYDEYTEEQLKNKLLETFTSNPNLENESTFEDIVEFTLGLNHTDENKKLTIDLIKMLEKDCSNTDSIKDNLKSDVVNELFYLMQQDADAKQRQQEYLEYIQSRINNEIIQNPNAELSKILGKYIPHSIEDVNFVKAEAALNIIDENDDISVAEKKLAYWDLKNNPNEILSAAEKYATNDGGNINETKAGEYILSVQKFDEAINDTLDDKHRAYAQIIEKRFIDNGQNNYPEAFELLQIYDNCPASLKPILLNEAQEHDKCNMKIFAETIKALEEKINFCNIDGVSEFEFYHPRSGETRKSAILPSAKQECWQYCVEHYNKNAFDRFYNFMDKFYEAASKWAKQEFGSAGIKDITGKETVFNEVKIKGGQEFGDWRLFATTKADAVDGVDKEFVFDSFGNHEWLIRQN
ncbi:MAG: hypothetical protein NC334_08915, partial [Bacteroides sp.]|nr:hypothetical protein [Bacteroides sp.]